MEILFGIFIVAVYGSIALLAWRQNVAFHQSRKELEQYSEALVIVSVKPIVWNGPSKRYTRKSSWLTTWEAKTPLGNRYIHYHEHNENAVPSYSAPPYDSFYGVQGYDEKYATLEDAQAAEYQRQAKVILGTLEVKVQ